MRVILENKDGMINMIMPRVNNIRGIYLNVGEVIFSSEILHGGQQGKKQQAHWTIHDRSKTDKRTMNGIIFDKLNEIASEILWVSSSKNFNRNKVNSSFVPKNFISFWRRKSDPFGFGFSHLIFDAQEFESYISLISSVV